jgi:hypothetical protein
MIKIVNSLLQYKSQFYLIFLGKVVILSNASRGFLASPDGRRRLVVVVSLSKGKCSTSN